MSDRVLITIQSALFAAIVVAVGISGLGLYSAIERENDRDDAIRAIASTVVDFNHSVCEWDIGVVMNKARLLYSSIEYKCGGDQHCINAGVRDLIGLVGGRDE